MYVSGMKNYPVGSGTVSWDGKDNDGNMVPAGEYTYYMWGYDGVNAKTLASWKMTWAHSTHPTFVTHDEKGVAKAQPDFYLANGTSKWTMGFDPLDSLLVETTSITVPTGGSIRQYLVAPDDYKYFYVDILEANRADIGKYERVPNGKSLSVTDWGTDEGYSFWLSGTKMTAGGGMAIVGDKIVVGSYDRDNANAICVLSYLDLNDGSLLQQIDIADRWFSLEDQAAGGQYSGGPGQVFAKNGMVFLSTFNACYREMIDPTIEDTDEYVKWSNGNGDYVGDHNFDPAAKLKWVCFDYNVQPYAYTTHADNNLFSTFGAYDMGAVSFGLIAPDGTGIGYFSYVGETAGYKQGNLYLKYGSAYDGIYTDNASFWVKAKVAGIGTWFIGHDSIKGTIGTQIGVKESAPAAFSVAQNTPNPFNPSTTISFTLAKAGKTTVDVFNSAGQKVDTIMNANLNAGSHSVTWNAANRSAGVYFYMIKSGNYSKTMKMTLVK
jgi:hypothetical protein